jgi:hypothetical protein
MGHRVGGPSATRCPEGVRGAIASHSHHQFPSLYSYTVAEPVGAHALQLHALQEVRVRQGALNPLQPSLQSDLKETFQRA